MWSRDPLIGKRIERCRVERPLGRGGHALAYLAFDEELREYRVLKIALPATPATGGAETRAFLEEGLLLSRLKHPQIVTLRSQGEFQGSRYMILDYIRGLGLKDLLAQVSSRVERTGCRWNEALPPSVAIALILSAARPLAYAHAANVHFPGRETRGVAHRDISPGNLILGDRGDERGRVILIDFGTAKTDLDTMTTLRHGPVGTVPYMSMTRLQKSHAGEPPGRSAFWSSFRETRHDVHSLGALLFQLLTGRLPFPGDGAPQIIAGILDRGRYAALGPEAEAVFPGAGKWVERCIVWHDFNQAWDRQPYQYPDAGASLPELEALLQQAAPGLSPEAVLTGFLRNLVPAPPPESRFDFPASNSSTNLWVAETTPPYAPDSEKTAGSSRSPRLPFSIAASILVAALAGLGWKYFAGRNKPRPYLAALEPLAPEAGPQPDRPRPPRKPPASPAAQPAKPERGQALSAQGYLDLQTEVRSRPGESLTRLVAAQALHPRSADVLFLKCEALASLEEWSPELRVEIESLLKERPVFTDPRLFRENLAYWRWRADLHQYQAHPEDEANRRNLSQSANAYLREFGANPVLRAKISRLPESISPQSP